MIMFKLLRAASAGLALLGLGLMSGTATADIVHLDDVIVDGSLCVGFDCVNGEAFGFDTIRLKENNLRIRAQDTSTLASFPSNDWQLTFNDSANGGANKFSIDDITGGRTPFTIEAGAPTNSLFVEDSGQIGLGTATPSVELHLVNGDTPTMRLEQNGSSGFTPQTWDVAGNETSFFIRDTTNGSTLPFRIRPGAPTSAIDIAPDGDVGIGTSSPAQALHVSGTGTRQVVLESTNNGAVQYRLISASENRRIVARDDTGSATETQIVLESDSIILAGPSVGPDTWATISALGIVTNIGSCTTATPCDKVFDRKVYTVPSIEEHARQMWTNQYLPGVGPTIQGQPINITGKMTRMLNELEKAHIYIEQLNEQNKALEKEVALLKTLELRIAELELNAQ